MSRVPGGDINTKTNLFRVFMVAFSCTIAIITPHFGLFVNLIGSVACASLAFIMPMMFHTRLQEMAPRDKIVPAFVIVIGVIGGSISLVMTIGQFAELGAEDAAAAANSTNATTLLAAVELLKAAVMPSS